MGGERKDRAMNPNEYGKIISQNLKRIMYEAGKTQADVSRDLKISKATLSSWMNGTRVPRMPKIDLLCHYFNCSRADLMEDHKEGEKLSSMTESMTELIEAAAGCTPDQIRAAIVLLKTLKGGL